MPKKIIPVWGVFFLLSFPSTGHAQRFLSEYDSTLFLKDTMPNVIRRYENLHFSGYIQPQFQVASEQGAKTYAGGDFQPYAQSRFMLRRARIKADYQISSKWHSLPQALFTFQIDATERGVNVRDMFVKIYEPRKGNLSATMGLFARPFGFEVNYSSSFRETPERGRMSQILMPTERDLGAMLSYDPQKEKKGKAGFKIDAGLFNGQGLAGTAEFDTYKDFIARATLKSLHLGTSLQLSGGLSFLAGGWRQVSRYRYETQSFGGRPVFMVDSSLDNIGKKLLKNYYGVDVQLAHVHDWGKTELRAEYWKGVQPGTELSTANPGLLPGTPAYLRYFDGGFFYLLQHIVNPGWQLLFKYDWYDPNTEVSGLEIGAGGTNFTAADIRYQTFGAGLLHHFNPHLKTLVYYDWVKNETTRLAGYTRDISDNVLTFRIQLLF